MALIKCKECNHQISNRAKTCPSCSCPIRSEDIESTKSSSGGCLTIVIGFLLIIFLIGLFNKSEPVKSQKLDITLPIYTQQAGNVGAMVCPIDLLFDKHVGHDAQALFDARTSIIDHEKKIADVGCEEVKGGLRVYIAPTDLKKIESLESSNKIELIFFGFDPSVTMGNLIFSSDLTNNPSGKYVEHYSTHKDIVDVASTNEKVKTAIDKLSSVWFRQDFQYGADKMQVVFIKSQRLEENGDIVGCHACGVDIAAVTYKQINNDWQFVAKQESIKIDGKWGDAPKIKQANIIRLTPNKVLFLITDSDLHQGYEDTSESLYLLSQNKWVDVGYIPTGEDYCFYLDEGHTTKCYKFKGKISVIPSTKDYPDLLVTKTGTQLDEKRNVIKAKNSVYVFKDGKYTEQIGVKAESSANTEAEKVKVDTKKTEPKYQWTHISPDSNDGLHLYEDKSTIERHGKLLTIIRMTDFDKEQSFNNMQYYSVMTKFEYDCYKLTSQALNSDVYSKNMGGGTIVRSQGAEGVLALAKESGAYKRYCTTTEQLVIETEKVTVIDKNAEPKSNEQSESERSILDFQKKVE